MRWPIWWYTRGFVFVARGGMSWVKTYAKSIAINVWMKNLFVPMYGMYDWQSRIISFFMRLAQIAVRAVGVLFISIGVLIVIVIYILAPPITILAFITQFIALYV